MNNLESPFQHTTYSVYESFHFLKLSSQLFLINETPPRGERTYGSPLGGVFKNNYLQTGTEFDITV